MTWIRGGSIQEHQVVVVIKDLGEVGWMRLRGVRDD